MGVIASSRPNLKLSRLQLKMYCPHSSCKHISDLRDAVTCEPVSICHGFNRVVTSFFCPPRSSGAFHLRGTHGFDFSIPHCL